MIEKLNVWLSGQGLSDTAVTRVVTVIELVGLLVLVALVHFLVHRVLLRFLNKLAARTHSHWDDALIQHKVGERAAQLVGALILQQLIPRVLEETPTLLAISLNLIDAYVILTIVLIISGSLSAMIDVFQTRHPSSKLTIRPLVQGVQVILWAIGLVLIIAALVDKSPTVFFAGLGTMTAVTMLVFRDSILGFVAGIQISTMDLVRRGDWIEVPQYGADGDVIEISLTTLKVQNWDKTISNIPTYALVSGSFKNWRGMSDSGGRRIKRSISIDMTSVRFCDDAMIKEFQKIQLLTGYIDSKQKELADYNQKNHIDENVLVNGRRMTNLGSFRAYLIAYLKDNPQISDQMTFLVRQLQPGPTGLPMEIYVFSRDQEWANYESIQSDIFDHVVASIPEFQLKVFQSPSGADIREGFGEIVQPSTSAAGDTEPAPT